MVKTGESMSEIDTYKYKASMQEARSQLIDDLSQKDFIVFAGAGIPEPTGVPLWKELLKTLYDKQPLNGVEVKMDDVNEYQYPNIAQMLFDEFATKGDSNDFKKTIQKKMQSTKIPHTVTQEEIIQACGGRIVTTNFDDTFESAFKRLIRNGAIKSELTVQTLSNLECEKVKENNCITYLHGKCNEDEIIFKKADYTKHYPSLDGRQESPLEKLLRYFYIECNISVVFVGFSFEDSYVMRSLERIYKETELDKPSIMNGINHYALLENKVSEDADTSKPKVKCLLEEMKLIEKNLKAIKIKVLRYEHNIHKEIDEIFTSINQMRKKQNAFTEPEGQPSS